MNHDSFLSDFSKKIADVILLAGTADFSSKLAATFKALVPTNNVMMIHYPSKKLPLVEYNDLPPENRSSSVESYVKGAFLLDPFYLAVRKRKLKGFYHLCDIVPKGFERSEYNSSYFRQTGLADECSYLINLDDNFNEFIIVSLGQIDLEKKFSDDDLDHLSDIAPLVDALVKHHWAHRVPEQEESVDMRTQLETALDAFGTSILTERENQTVQMILHGYSNRAIAERLAISIETVKLHRKNAYSKLDLGSQGELFNLFINSLMNIDNYCGGDPLIPYFGHAS